MNKEKRRSKQGINLFSQEIISAIGEREIKKYLGTLKAGIIK